MRAVLFCPAADYFLITAGREDFESTGILNFMISFSSEIRARRAPPLRRTKNESRITNNDTFFVESSNPGTSIAQSYIFSLYNLIEIFCSFITKYWYM